MINFLNAFKKWVLTASVTASSIALVLSGHLTGEQWMELHKVIVPAFVGANVANVGGNVAKQWLKSKKK